MEGAALHERVRLVKDKIMALQTKSEDWKRYDCIEEEMMKSEGLGMGAEKGG